MKKKSKISRPPSAPGLSTKPRKQIALSQRFFSILGRARISMQVDVGFGDSVYPKPKAIDYPVILDFPKPHLKGYTIETVVAEKLKRW